MIHVIDDYYVQADTYGYTALLYTNKKDKEGNDSYKTVGYYGNIKLAVEGIAKHMHKNIASKEIDLELNEYLKQCEDINLQLSNILDRIKDTISF